MGMTWTDQIPSSKADLSSVNFFNDQVGYAAGGSGEILKTTNGGASWEVQSLGNPTSINDMDFFSENQLVVGSRDGLYLTPDGGNSWNPIAITDLDWVESVTFIDESSICYGTIDGKVFITDTLGSVRTEVLDAESSIESLFFVDSDLGWCVEKGGKIYHTNNGGDSWNEQFSNSEELSNIYFIDPSVGFALGRFSDTILFTTNGGADWNKGNLPQATFWGGITFMDRDTGWIAGGTATTGVIYITTNGGISWEPDYWTTFSFTDINAPVNGDKLAWAVGPGGVIARFSECNDEPTISNLEGPSIVCKNDTIDMTVDFKGIDIFTWTVPDGWFIVGNNTSSKIRVVVGIDPGDITVTGANSCGKQANELLFSGTPIDNPGVVITEEGGILTCEVTGASYQWYINGSPIDGANEITYTASETGDYHIRVTYENGCTSNASNIISVVVSGTVDLDGVPITLYPNPARDYFILKGDKEIHRIQLYNMSGHMVPGFGPGSTAYSLEGIPAGLYLLEVTSGGKAAFMKLVVERGTNQ
jgi:photosystem II stability/assembly factor-like uncharacterized protein